jgi:hypothetical protein
MICRPCGAVSCMRSASSLGDDRGGRHRDHAAHDEPGAPVEGPAGIAPPSPSAMHQATCAPPNPNTVARIAISCCRMNSEADENIRNTTPNSAR